MAYHIHSEREEKGLTVQNRLGHSYHLLITDQGVCTVQSTLSIMPRTLKARTTRLKALATIPIIIHTNWQVLCLE